MYDNYKKMLKRKQINIKSNVKSRYDQRKHFEQKCTCKLVYVCKKEKDVFKIHTYKNKIKSHNLLLTCHVLSPVVPCDTRVTDSCKCTFPPVGCEIKYPSSSFRSDVNNFTFHFHNKNYSLKLLTVTAITYTN